jgi:UDP-N-acetylmuramate-alanine ligase
METKPQVPQYVMGVVLASEYTRPLANRNVWIHESGTGRAVVLESDESNISLLNWVGKAVIAFGSYRDHAHTFWVDYLIRAGDFVDIAERVMGVGR